MSLLSSTTIVADDVERLGERAIGALEAGLLVLRDLASHRELHVVVARERVEHATGAAAHADDGHPHAVVGALPGEQGLVAATVSATAPFFKSSRRCITSPWIATRVGGNVHFRLRDRPRRERTLAESIPDPQRVVSYDDKRPVTTTSSLSEGFALRTPRLARSRGALRPLRSRAHSLAARSRCSEIGRASPAIWNVRSEPTMWTLSGSANAT